MFAGKSWAKITVASLIFTIASGNVFLLFHLNRTSGWHQLLAWVIAIGIAILFLSVRFSWENWRSLDLYSYFFILIFLALPLFLAAPVRGSRRWFSWGAFSLQPSEIIKPFWVIVLVSLLDRWRLAISLKRLFIFVFLLFLPVIFLLREPDLGNALLFLGMGLIAALLYYPSPQKLAFSLLGLGVLASFFVFPFLSSYQRQRLTSFLQPGHDPLGAGYNVLQAKISIGAAGWWGHGFGEAFLQRLKFLPEYKTDFIFASLVYGIGLGGAILFLLIYGALFSLLWHFAFESKSWWLLVAKFLLVLQLWLQFVINVGMNLGLLPVTGLPLPFFSYGGSSLFGSLLALAFILA